MIEIYLSTTSVNDLTLNVMAGKADAKDLLQAFKRIGAPDWPSETDKTVLGRLRDVVNKVGGNDVA